MTHPALHRCQDCGDKATTYRMRYGWLNWLCEDCANPPTYLLCACGLETRERCVDIGCPDAKVSKMDGNCAAPSTLGEAMLEASDRNEPWYKPEEPNHD